VLGALEAEVTRTLRGIERGLAMLDERRAAYAPEPEPAAVEDGYAPEDGYVDEEAGAPTAAHR
jgi:hypothetical protein